MCTVISKKKSIGLLTFVRLLTHKEFFLKKGRSGELNKLNELVVKFTRGS